MTQTFVIPDNRLYEILLDTGKDRPLTLEASATHPFYIPAKGWRTTTELAPGDVIETDGQTSARVISVNDLHNNALTYNFAVADFETYYVSRERVLVHNCPEVDEVAKRPSSFRKKTVKDSWDDAADGSQTRSKRCPDCKKDVFGDPHKNEKRNGPDGWDNDHQPKWKDRDLSGMDRKQVLDEYNKDTRLRCPSCNRADNQ